MVWTNGPIEVYHGCEVASLPALSTPSAGHAHGVDITRCSPLTDFGQGFYTTSNPDQARQWANQRCRRRFAGGASPVATVIGFTIDRNRLADLGHLAFVSETNDFYELVRYCRGGGSNHARPAAYDVVYGPVALWPQRIVLKDCDQISFHTRAGLMVLSAPTVIGTGMPFF